MGKVYTCLTHRWIEQLIRTINETYDLNRWRIVNVFHDGREKDLGAYASYSGLMRL